MWIKKAKYEVEKLKAAQRIEYLENLICPNQNHDFKQIDTEMYGGTGHGDEQIVYVYRCERCGKIIKK